MRALECVIGTNHKSVSWVQYVNIDFQDHVELSDNAVAVISDEVEVRKDSGIKQLKQLIKDMKIQYFSTMKRSSKLNECYYNSDIEQEEIGAYNKMKSCVSCTQEGEILSITWSLELFPIQPLLFLYPWLYSAKINKKKFYISTIGNYFSHIFGGQYNIILCG